MASVSSISQHLPHQVIDFHEKYKNVLSGWRHQLAVEQYDILMQSYSLFLENNLSFQSLAKHYGMRPLLIGGVRVWRAASVAASISVDADNDNFFSQPATISEEYDETEVPVGLIANTHEFSRLTKRGIRNAQIQVREQTKRLAEYSAGRVDEKGQAALFCLEAV